LRRFRWAALSLLLIASASVTAQSNFREELNLGTQAFREAKYEEAVRHFQNAAALEPQNAVAHLYLATAYAEQYIPGVDSPENVGMAEAAISEYQGVLKIDPHSLNSLKGVAYLHLQMKKFDDAKSYYRKATELDASDAENYYSIGVIDWTQAYTIRMERREKLRLKPEQPLINVPECWDVRNSTEGVVKEGMEMIGKALELRSDYDDAMAYMNLMYRERADIQCNDPGSYASDLKAADHWVDVTISTKKVKAEKADHKQPNPATNNP
jgi:tetratricopeptide (TPR) repeat protein